MLSFASRSPRLLRGLLLTIFLTLLNGPAIAESSATGKHTVTLPAIEFAQRAIIGHQYQLARVILTRLVKERPKAVEPRFLLAKIEELQGNSENAVNLYRGILVDHPDEPRVRLDLALLLFNIRDDESAEYNLRLALGEKLPPPVEKNVFALLDTIRARSRFQYDLTVALAPDTNANTGSDQRTVTLFGLPATLSSEARSQSGIGGFVSMGVQYRQPIGEDYRLRVGAIGYRTQYRKTSFDDMFARTYVGPQRLFTRGDMSLLAVVDKRWYGDLPYEQRVGPRVELEYDVSNAWRLLGGFEFLDTSYWHAQQMNGTYADLSVTPIYALSRTAYLQFILEYVREETRDPYLTDQIYRFGFSYHREIIGGFTIALQPEYEMNPFKEPNPFFGVTRVDEVYRIGISTYNRRWQFRGFCPTLNYTFTNDLSNIGLYRYQRSQIQIGMTKEF